MTDDRTDFPHERLEVYRLLARAYAEVTAWQGLPTSRGSTGDQLRRALTGALLRYTEGFYAQAGHQAALWSSSRGSCGESAAAIAALAIEGRVPRTDAEAVRLMLARAMRMLWRLSHRADPAHEPPSLPREQGPGGEPT